MSMQSINPATGQVIKEFPTLTSEQIKQKIELAQQAFNQHRNTSFSSRAECMFRAAEILEKESEQWGRLMTQEMGKTYRSAVEEAKKCAWACRYYAENAERFLADEVIATNATKSYIHYLPLGPILAVMPWNFPFWQVFRFAAPAIMAGNVGLLKHASNVPQSALAIEEIIRRAGFQEGIFQTLLISSSQVPQVVDDYRVKAATLTGSTPAGSSVAAEAGKHMKKTVLELGGSDPFIVMPSANIEEAARTAVTARTINNGQSCIAAKRFIVHEKIADDFTGRFADGIKSLKVGDPMDEATQVGPLATHDILKDLDNQVQRSIEMGARPLVGCKPIEGPGNFYQPSILTDIPVESPAYREEVFGPVALLFRVKNIDEAISLANDSNFGLGSSAWTNGEAERQRFINEIEAGQTFINGMVASDPRLPFGGVKDSGYGRELSYLGIREFVNIKTIWIKDGGEHNRTETE